ncbi:YpiF family protein [bacterium LRH843]|nr:YpiF family protein [bacterium LRH843]
MKWQTKEIDTYLKEKEYVDTAIIPLIPISWQKEVKSTVALGEFISIIALEVERQFQGRVIHFPPFAYLKDEEVDIRVGRLREWMEELKKGDIKHIFFLTSDAEWKVVEQQLEDGLIWLPSIPLEHLDEKYKRDIITEQIKQLIPVLINKWK